MRDPLTPEHGRVVLAAGSRHVEPRGKALSLSFRAG